MRESSKKNMPDIMEAIFDAGYLIFALIAGILFFVAELRSIWCQGSSELSMEAVRRSGDSWESDYRYLRSR